MQEPVWGFAASPGWQAGGAGHGTEHAWGSLTSLPTEAYFNFSTITLPNFTSRIWKSWTFECKQMFWSPLEVYIVAKLSAKSTSHVNGISQVQTGGTNAILWSFAFRDVQMGFAVRVRSAGQKYGPTCHQRDRADVTEFVTLVRLSSLGQHVGVLALAGYKHRKSALTAGPIKFWNAQKISVVLPISKFEWADTLNELTHWMSWHIEWADTLCYMVLRWVGK